MDAIEPPGVRRRETYGRYDVAVASGEVDGDGCGWWLGLLPPFKSG